MRVCLGREGASEEARRDGGGVGWGCWLGGCAAGDAWIWGVEGERVVRGAWSDGMLGVVGWNVDWGWAIRLVWDMVTH